MKVQTWQKILGMSLILSCMQLSAVTCGNAAKQYLKEHPDIFSNNYNDIIGKLYDPDDKIDAQGILNDTANDHYMNIGAKAGSCSPFDPPVECNTDLCCKAYYPDKKCPKDSTQDAIEDQPESSSDKNQQVPVIVQQPAPSNNTSGLTSEPIPDAMDPDL